MTAGPFRLPNQIAPEGVARPQDARGDRATWKVRRIARARYRELGQLRYVEAIRGGRWLYLFLGGLFVILSGLTFAGAGNLTSDAIVIVAFAMIFALIFWFAVQDKLLVFERGVVLGSFSLGTRPMALPFYSIDAATIRAPLGWGQRRGLPVLIAPYLPFEARHNHHPCAWSPYAVTFHGPDPTIVRGATGHRRAQRQAVLHPGEAPPTTIWSIGTTTPARLENLVHELATALHDAGAPGADDVIANALPPRRLTGTVQDADYIGIPPAQRARNLPTGAA